MAGPEGSPAAIKAQKTDGDLSAGQTARARGRQRREEVGRHQVCCCLLALSLSLSLLFVVLGAAKTGCMEEVPLNRPGQSVLGGSAVKQRSSRTRQGVRGGVFGGADYR